MDNETLASLLRGRNRAGQPVDATANIIGPALSALGNTIYGAGRGALTAMAGLPGDINQLITDNIGTLVNAQGLPTTKEIQDFLPAKPTSYEGKLAQKLGEFVPVNPTPIAKGAVAIAKPVGKAMGEQAYRMTEDMLQKQGMMPSIVAYHGTPHNIEGAFDISKVGTGENAQSYGHGMYYAENPSVAESYKGRTVFNEPTLDKFTNGPNYYTDSEGKYFKVRDYVRNDKPVEVSADEYNSKFKEVLKKFNEQNQGNLYKVDIPDEYVPKMLDWDKPLSEQSKEVQEALAKLEPDLFSPKSMDYDANERGQWIYMRLAGKTTKKNATNKLNEFGIKGIRYLDEGSRGKEKGTSNFVVFDPKEVKILEKNSKPVSRKDIIEEQINNLK